MIPKRWKRVKIADVATLVTSGSRGWAEYYNENGDYFVRITNLRRENILPDFSKMKYVCLPNNTSEGQRTRLCRGDILISITADLGMIGYIESDFDRPAYINQHIALVRLNEDINNKFVAYLLSTKEYNLRFQQLNDAGAKAGLNLSTIKSLELTLPPLAEQRRIAEILSIWDQAIETTEKLIANSQAQKKALMQQLFPREGEANPCLRFPEFRDAGEWISERIGDVCELYQPETLSASQLNQDGDFVVYGANGIIGKHDRYSHKDSEIIVTCRGATCGEVHVTQPRSWISGNAMVVLPQRAITKKFIYFSLKNNGLKSVVSGSAQPQITRIGFSPLLISFPSKKEQQKIADCLSTLDETISAVDRELERLKTQKTALMQQLLTGKRRVTITSCQEKVRNVCVHDV